MGLSVKSLLITEFVAYWEKQEYCFIWVYEEGHERCKASICAKSLITKFVTQTIIAESAGLPKCN